MSDNQIVLSLGSNINRDHNIRYALREIIASFGQIDISPIYETVSVGFEGPPFVNLVCGFSSDKPLLEIRERLRTIETNAGRVRGKKSFDNRILDIDVVLFGNHNFRPRYNVPRDEIEKYAYVLKPLSELYPDKVHPITTQTYKEMWRQFSDDTQKLRRIEFSF